MANRTLQFFGVGYGTEPVSLTATINGAQVFNGTITTFNSAVNTTNPWTQVALMFTAEIDETLVQNIPLSITVAGGSAVVGDVHADKLPKANPVYSDADFDILMANETNGTEIASIISKYASPAFTAEELALVESNNPADSTARKNLLQSRNLQHYIFAAAGEFSLAHNLTDTISNVTVNGAAVTDSDARALKVNPSFSHVYWQINNGETLSCMLGLPQAILA